MDYSVELRQDGGVWLVSAPTLEGVHSYGRTVREALSNIKEAIAAAEDLDDWSDLKLRVERVDDESVSDLLEATLALRVLAERTSRAERAVLSWTVKALHEDECLSFRDTGSILGLSHQRVAQLYAESQTDKPPFERQNLLKFLDLLHSDRMDEVEDVIELLPAGES